MGHGSSKSSVCSFSPEKEVETHKTNNDKPPSNDRRLSLKRSSSKIVPSPEPSIQAQNVNCDSDIIAQPNSTDSNVPEDGYLSCVQLFNTLCDGQNIPYLFDPKYLLLIDTRPLDRYEQSHIVTAKHFSVLENSFLIGCLEEYVNIVLYSDEGQVGFNDVSLTDTQLHFSSSNTESTILLGGFDLFQAKFPFLCTSEFIHSEDDRKTKLTIYPSIIIDNCLYQGRGDQATNSNIVNDLKITHIVNITKEHKCAFPDSISYLTLQIDDESQSDLYSQFSKIITYLENAIAGDGRVLIHCNLGVSRSSAASIAYLMHSRKCTLQDAYDFVKNRRPMCKPNRGFLKQLSRFENDLFGKVMTDIDDIWM